LDSGQTISYNTNINVCLPVTSAIPRYNKEEIDKDIDGVKTWIDKTKDEL